MIVGVRLKSNYTGKWSVGEYNYLTDLSLSLGELVECPTRNGESATGRVERINVDVSIIPPEIVPRLRTIERRMEEANQIEA